MGDKYAKEVAVDTDGSRNSSHTEDVIDIGHNGDVAHVSTIGGLDPTSEEFKAMEKRLVRKIDIHLLPMLILLYIL